MKPRPHLHYIAADLGYVGDEGFGASPLGRDWVSVLIDAEWPRFLRWMRAWS